MKPTVTFSRARNRYHLLLLTFPHRESMNSADNHQSALKRILGSVVPKRLIEERGIFLRLGHAGRTYAKLRLLDTMGIRQSNLRSVGPGARSFLFVCYGNIMR